MKTILRIEGPDGVGPFNSWLPGWNWLAPADFDDPFPYMRDDNEFGGRLIELAATWDYRTRYGFGSVEQMLKYFAVRPDVDDTPYCVAVYQVNDDAYFVGHHQAVFDQTRAQRLARLPVTKAGFKAEVLEEAVRSVAPTPDAQAAA